jgi:hypothetical protein
MSEPNEVWIPLVDEPIGRIVERVQSENADIARLVESPHRVLAFKTFAYIQVGKVLGELLFDSDVPADARETWVEEILRDPAHYERIVAEVRAVAEEIAADPTYADEGPIGPDDDTRARFREFARKQLGGT